MSDCSASLFKRNGFRLALTGLVGIWLSGCSADSTRLAEPLGNPFSNPFSTASNDAAAPTPRVASAPIATSSANPNYVAAAHPNPVAVASLPNPAPTTTGQIRPPDNQPVSGFGKGWTAVGGSPVIVAQGDSLETMSRRYGVPSSALLGANGLTSASDVHPGMRLVVPVYNANGKTAAAEPEKAREVADADEPKPHAKPKKKADADVADASADAPKAKAKKKDVETAALDAEKTKADKLKADKAKAKKKAPDADASAEPTPAPRPVAKAELAKPDAKAEAKAEAKAAAKPVAPVAVAKVDPPAAKPGAKKPDADATPTGSVHPTEPAPAAPITGEQADASGVSPEFRWPARGRIIMGFKAGGNDGINISVPEGTSVRAAENGVVAYAGSELKGYGNLVLIRHPNGFVSAYANNGELNVKRGDTVKRGQVIAKSGQTGNVSSPQLHFELRKGSTPVDPTSYLAGL